MGALVLERDADGVVEGNRLADLCAGVGSVVLLIDRGALDLHEEPGVMAMPAPAVVEQVDRLAGHVGQAGLVRRPYAGCPATSACSESSASCATGWEGNAATAKM